MRSKYVVAWAVGFALASVALLVLAARADAQEASFKDLTPRLGHGILTGVTMTYMDENFDYHTSMFNGAGYKVFVSLKDASDFSWIAIGIPAIMSADTAADKMAFAMGIDLTLAGNFGIGAVYDLISTGPRDSGLFTGYTDKRNLKFLISFNLPLGGGGVVNGYR